MSPSTSAPPDRPPEHTPPALARRWPRFASAFYEGFLLLALAFIGTLLFFKVVGDSTEGLRRHLLQAWLVALSAGYFAWFWTRSGQTLAMKTWGLRVTNADGARLGTGAALLRFAVATAGLAAGGLGLWWSFIDRDGLFLHDRLLGTRVIKAPI
jgi:uncharacterized RDD family membrane protein YckC